MKENQNVENVNMLDNMRSSGANSRLLSTKVKDVPYSELASYYLKETGISLDAYFKSEGQAALTNAALKALGKVVKPKVMGIISLVIDIAGVITAINDAMEAVELGKAVYNVWKAKAKALRVTTYNYEWRSGSGNHYSYYSEVKYSTVW